jgi:hypothetical protein
VLLLLLLSHMQLFKPPPGVAATPPAAAKAPAAKHAGAARMSTADETAAAAAAEHAAPLEPCSLLSPELASVLNPLVVYTYKASCLPDLPASRQQLETLCEPVTLKTLWPPLVSTAMFSCRSVLLQERMLPARLQLAT